MTEAPVQRIDLANAFQAVSQVLAENKPALNEADTVNHDHGDNMVQIFNMISGAIQERADAPQSDQLKYAAQVVRQQSTSSSGQLYAAGLQNASTQFKGKPVTQKNAMELIQALMGMGGGAAASAPAAPQQAATPDLGSLLGGLMGGASPQQQQQAEMPAGLDLLGSLLGGGTSPQQNSQTNSAPGMDDLLGSLLGGGNAAPQQQDAQSGGAPGLDLLGSLLGGGNTAPQQQQQQGGGVDIAQLLQMGLGYYQATQSGKTPLQALVQVLLSSGSPMGGRGYRAQSGALVMQTLMQALSGGAR